MKQFFQKLWAKLFGERPLKSPEPVTKADPWHHLKMDPPMKDDYSEDFARARENGTLRIGPVVPRQPAQSNREIIQRIENADA